LPRGRRARCCSWSPAPARSRACAAGLPATPLLVRSMSTKWLSVPPEDQLESAGGQTLGQRLRVGHHRCGVAAENPRWPPLSGPPRWLAVVWLLADRPAGRGRPPLSMALACAASHISIAPRGPAQGLVRWVVEKLTGACPTGDGCAPTGQPGRRLCAMSATSTASISRAISAKRREVDGARHRGAAAPDQLGPLGERDLANPVHVHHDRLSRRTS